MENWSRDETKQVEMLEKLDFFKSDHHLSSGGTLKPDERKRADLRHIVPALTSFYSFLLQYLMDADGAAGAAGLRLIVALRCQRPVCVCKNVTASPPALSHAVVVFFSL